MPITREKVQVTWGGNATVSITAGAAQTSDPYTLPDDTAYLRLLVKADKGAATSTDIVAKVYILGTTGDPDADPDVADEYTTPAHAPLVVALDTNKENPAIADVPLDVDYAAIKLYVKNEAATDPVTVSAQLLAVRIS